MLTLLKKIILSISLSLSFSPLCMANEYIFNVYGRSDIEHEIAVAKILPFYQYLGGKIEVQWANPDLLISVNKAIALLEKEGVHSYDIIRNFTQNMADKSHNRDSINLVLKTLSNRTGCASYTLKSSFNAIGDEGCSINDNIDVMKLHR